MSIKTLGDITSPIANHATYLEDIVKNFHEKLERYWANRDFLHKAFSASIDDSSCIKISIPKLQFFCMSRNRLVFFEKTLFNEIDFFIKNKKGDEDISILKCYMSVDGVFFFNHPNDGESFDHLNDHGVDAVVYQKLIESASEMKIISI